ncbi:ThuA domain-containing protein [Actinacidiphila bryophytorum]|uniref:Type 1 glutamine amidotransferase (GATase1) n=1 Tax=Actinacidiphila bryophytorum TaxID=1436133 RepID=A0A9W4H3G7_9ACTN|nr:ThuA domain-containing protein [Actinacidiphila bryophytorum]MBM9438099.1 ThuA domain-containing protein [Actinacidiphila bryophytorum]MBN6545673.1 ThuA domain-containing protein [Actinacidiphila bryophytorum]CAG7647355.1 Type 1 glutamine amidotransferase (GATase1) [Actinacidiphila bryophytorum]
MRTPRPRTRLALLAALSLSAAALLTAAAPAADAAPARAFAGPAAAAPFKVLVFSKTTGYRHDSIPAGIAAIQQLGLQNNFTVVATEDDTQFTDANLAQYAAVVFLSATGDPVTTQSEKDAFQRYIENGGGYVGIHAASDSGYSWSWYGSLVGAYFKQHPAIQPATVDVEDHTHPSTAGLPNSYTHTDEWYDFQTNPRSAVHVLASVDDSSYSGSTMGADHPTTWCHDFDGGRAWYTGMGHTIESYTEPNFLHLLLGGIQTAAGAVAADCSAGSTPPPVEHGIHLKAHANGKYVTAPGTTQPLIAGSTTVGTNETFDEVDLGGGNIALRAHVNNQFVTAENAGAQPLIANRAAAAGWETFQLIHNSDGSISLKAAVNGRYVTAENAGAAALIANRTAIGPWEEFDLSTS